MDFRQFYRAAEHILAGDDPYPRPGDLLTASGKPWVYPPFPALLVTPLTLVSLGLAGKIVMASMVVVALAIPFVLGVRDWRCYGVMFLWPPMISAIQTANPTLWLALAAALAWRYRDRTVMPAVSIGVTLAVKFVLWPLLLRFVATRRVVSAALAVVVGGALLVGSWAVIGFAGMTDYPDLLRRLDDAVGDDAYSVFNLAHDLGAPDLGARLIWLGTGFALLLLCVLYAKKGDEASSFVIAIAAALAVAPLVWLHYFALLVVVAALARPRLGVLWLVPLVMIFCTGSGDPSPIQTALALGAAATTIVLALRELRVPGAVR